jgi:CheY-like chemotaxis protein
VQTILVVDDEVAITETLGEVLSDEGFRVFIARNGKDGLRRVAEQHPEIILLDYMMPVMDGSEMLRALRANTETESIPVVLMSSAPYASLPGDCTPNAFLRKPFDIDALLAELAKHLPLHRPE